MKRFLCLMLALCAIVSCEWKADPYYFSVQLFVVNHSDQPVECTFYCDEWSSASETPDHILIPEGNPQSKYGGKSIFSIRDIAYSYDDVYQMISGRYPNPVIRIYGQGHFGEDDYLLEEVPLTVFKGKEYKDDIPGFYAELSYADLRPAKHPCTAIYYYFEGADD